MVKLPSFTGGQAPGGSKADMISGDTLLSHLLLPAVPAPPHANAVGLLCKAGQPSPMASDSLCVTGCAPLPLMTCLKKHGDSISRVLLLL